MARIDDGGYAFPGQGSDKNGWDPTYGMSLRDWFAGQALAGLLAANATYSGRTDNREAMATDAFAHADAMLKASAAQKEQARED